jgi:hypothetical protein
MLSRALSLATVALLVGCFAAIPVQAQNLEAGKSPSQIFAGTCAVCHKSPRGLLKTVAAGSLPGFLRQHYTTSSDMASLLSAFVISNGANDTRYVGGAPRQGKDAKSEAKPSGPDGPPEQLDRQGRRLRPAPPSQEAAGPDAKPDPDGLSLEVGPGHRGRNAKRPARPEQAPDAAQPAVDGQDPAQAASERGLEGRRSAAKQRGKRGKPGSEEPFKTDAAKDAAKSDAAKSDAAKTDAVRDEPSKGEPAKEEKPTSETAKDEGHKPEGTRPSGDGKSEAAKSEAAKPEAPKPNETGSGESSALRADPVPAVTPAPPASPAPSAETSSAMPEPAAPTPSAAPAAHSAPPAVAPGAVSASAPPVAPAGPPEPPISK